MSINRKVRVTPAGLRGGGVSRRQVSPGGREGRPVNWAGFVLG